MNENEKFTNIGDDAITRDEYNWNIIVKHVNLRWNNHNARYKICSFSDMGKIRYGNCFGDGLPKKWLGELLL